MKHIKTGSKRRFFEVLHSTSNAQAAIMTLRPGKATGEPANEHPWAEQWVFVVSGTGRAVVDGRKVQLRENSLLLIEKDQVHQITNTGRGPLVTLNIYTPPAYDDEGELLTRWTRVKQALV